MAVTASGLFVATFVDVLDTTQLAIDLDLETHKLALFSNSITPNFTTDTAYGVSPYDANEVSGTGWSAGGVALTGTTFTGGSGTATFDATDVSQSTTTLTNARCALLYADALAGDNAIVLVDFTADYSTVAGTFAITWNASGIFYIDLTP
jgi:hypothetical protein